MARVGRLAGAILAESEGRYYLIGNTKEPCDFRAHGFEPPGEIDATKRPFVLLTPSGEASIAAPWIAMDGEGEALAGLLAERLLIERNGSVSERLWRLVLQVDDEAGAPPASDVRDVIHARWLSEVPAPIWRIVRDTVLRCT